MKTVKDALKKVKVEGGGSLETKVNRFLLAYRTTPHSTTGIPPAQMMFQRQLRTALSLIKPNLHERLCGKQMSRVHGRNGRANVRRFQVLDKVAFRNYGAGSRWIEGVVTTCLGTVNYEIQDVDGVKHHRHVDQMFRRPTIRNTQVSDEVNLPVIPMNAPASGESANNNSNEADSDDADSEPQIITEHPATETEVPVEAPATRSSVCARQAPAWARSGEFEC